MFVITLFSDVQDIRYYLFSLIPTCPVLFQMSAPQIVTLFCKVACSELSVHIFSHPGKHGSSCSNHGNDLVKVSTLVLTLCPEDGAKVNRSKQSLEVSGIAPTTMLEKCPELTRLKNQLASSTSPPRFHRKPRFSWLASPRY